MADTVLTSAQANALASKLDLETTIDAKLAAHPGSTDTYQGIPTLTPTMTPNTGNSSTGVLLVDGNGTPIHFLFDMQARLIKVGTRWTADMVMYAFGQDLIRIAIPAIKAITGYDVALTDMKYTLGVAQRGKGRVIVELPGPMPDIALKDNPSVLQHVAITRQGNPAITHDEALSMAITAFKATFQVTAVARANRDKYRALAQAEDAKLREFRGR